MHPTMKIKIRILFFVTLTLLFVCSRYGAAATDAPTVVELLPPNGASGGGFGRSVSLFNDTLVIGAVSSLNGAESGVVYVFTRSGISWQQQATLVAEHGSAGDGFGASVSISGDTIVVGAAGDDDKGAESGAMYVFVRSGTAWQQQAKLTAGDGAAGDNFGFAAAIDGDTIVVGAPFDDGKGSAYTFLRSAGTWQQQAKLLAYGGSAVGDRFGCSVAIGYDTLVVGADGDDTKATDDGSVFVFTPYGSGWRYQAKLVASDASQGDRFGWSVAVGLDKALIGVNRTQGDGAARPGAAYAFIRTGSSWSERQRLKGGNEGTDDGFGFTVSLYDNFYVIGAPRESVDAVTSGAVYLFSRAETLPWPLHAKYLAPSGANGDLFGAGTAIFGDTVVTGVPGRGEGTAFAYMYPCGLGRYLPASDWQMISRPCFNLSPASTLLGDDIEGGIYAKTWTIYRSDPANAIYYYNPYGYFQLATSEPLSQGIGYWIYSVKAGTLEVNGLPTPTINSNECPGINGCVEIPLTWPPSGRRFWNNMVGNPFPYAVDWSNVVVVVTPSDGSSPLTLTPSQAYEKKFLLSSFYRYESKRLIAYNDVTPGMRGLIMPFESIWVHTLDPQDHAFPASAIKLLIPAVGPLKASIQ